MVRVGQVHSGAIVAQRGNVEKREKQTVVAFRVGGEAILVGCGGKEGYFMREI